MWKYTTILHEQRQELGLDLNEYATADYIARNGYSLKKLVDFLGISKQGVLGIVERLMDKGILDGDSGDIIATDRWDMSAYGEVKKVDQKGQESLPREVKKVDHTILSIDKRKTENLEDSVSDSFSSHSEEDISIEATDDEGNPLTRNGFSKKPRAAGPGKNILAIRVTHMFQGKCKAALQISPILDHAAYQRALAAVKVLDAVQIEQLIDDWFDQSRPDEELVSITAALSTNSINRYVAKYGLKI